MTKECFIICLDNNNYHSTDWPAGEIFLLLIRLETWRAGLDRPAWNIKTRAGPGESWNIPTITSHSQRQPANLYLLEYNARNKYGKLDLMKPTYSEIHQKAIYVQRFGSKGKLIKLQFHNISAVSSVQDTEGKFGED